MWGVIYSRSDVNRSHWKELAERSTTAVSLSVFQVDPLFTVPAPPPPVSSSLAPQILPSYFSPSSSNIAAPVEQLLVRTRSVGVNTCEVGVVTEPECLGPCEPGTSVNLEGIVWHETEEGKYNLFFMYFLVPSFPVIYLCPPVWGICFAVLREERKVVFVFFGFLLKYCLSFVHGCFYFQNESGVPQGGFPL